MSQISKRKIILLVIAGIVALGTMIVAKALMTTSAPAPVQEAQVKTTEILAAARDMPTGTILKDSDMKWIVWPADADTSRFYLKGKDEIGPCGWRRYARQRTQR